MARKIRARHHRRRANRALYEYVAQRLQAGWSPECIAGRLELDYPGDHAMRVSTEAIYRWIFRDAQAGGQLYRFLCLGHKRPRKQRRYGSLRGLIPGACQSHSARMWWTHEDASATGREIPSTADARASACLPRSNVRAVICSREKSRIGAPPPWCACTCKPPQSLIRIKAFGLG